MRLTQRLKGTGGMTLGEMLVVLALLGAMVGGMFHFFSQTLRLWKWTQEWRMSDEDMGFEKMRSELMGSLASGKGAFQGTDRSFQFLSEVELPVRSLGAGGEVRIPVQVAYDWDSALGKIRRQEFLWPDSKRLSKETSVKERLWGESIRDWSIRYYFYDAQIKKYSYISSWNSDVCLPQAVEVSLVRWTGKETERIVRSFDIPSGGCRV